MTYPKQFLDAKRWMVRPTGKQSISAFDKRPFDYEQSDDDIGPDSWRWRWNVQSVLSSYEQAKSYWDRHSKAIEGLTFVIHPFGNHEQRTRLICLDFDKAISVDGIVDKSVADLIELLGSYTEISKSGRGLHTFILVEDCPAFSNCLRRPYGDCRVDLLCSNPVNVTGDIFCGLGELAAIPFSTLQELPFFEFKEPKGAHHQQPEWWSEDPLDDIPERLEYLIPWMEMETAIEGEGGSLKLFAAACRLMRHGVTGREAEALLRHVPAIPPFEPDQIQRVVECAYSQTQHDDQFNNPAPEFEKLYDAPDIEEEPEQNTTTDREKRYGFNFMTMDELDEADLTLEYLIDGAFVGEGALFIGGREKTFKTCIAADLLVSLATGTPFLNHFATLGRRSSVLFTAEIGMARAKTLVKSVCRSRGLGIRDAKGFIISDGVPSFKWNKMANKPADEVAIRKLKRFLKDVKPEVAVFDPLYFAMGGAAVGDMYEIGEVLRHITGICKDANVWPIFCHHAKKDSNKEYEPMDLNDFYGSGVGAFARQWILLAHCQPFRNGIAKLYANIGGSSQGARGIFDMTIDEGNADDLSDRRWDVTVEESSEERGIVTDYTVTRAMDGCGLIGIPELTVHLNCDGQEHQVKRVLHELVRSGIVNMRNNKFELSSGGFPNDQVD